MSPGEVNRSVELLVEFGVWRKPAEQIVSDHALTPKWVERACADLSGEATQGRLRNPQAVLLSRIAEGWEPPPVEEPASLSDEVHLLESDVKFEASDEADAVILPAIVDGAGQEHAAHGWFQAVKDELKLQLVRETYDTWIRPAKLVNYLPPADGQPPILTIQLHNLYAREWIKQRRHKVVKRIVDRQLGTDVTIEYQAPSPDEAHDTEWLVA